MEKCFRIDVINGTIQNSDAMQSSTNKLKACHMSVEPEDKAYYEEVKS